MVKIQMIVQRLYAVSIIKHTSLKGIMILVVTSTVITSLFSSQTQQLNFFENQLFSK